MDRIQQLLGLITDVGMEMTDSTFSTLVEGVRVMMEVPHLDIDVPHSPQHDILVDPLEELDGKYLDVELHTPNHQDHIKWDWLGYIGRLLNGEKVTNPKYGFETQVPPDDIEFVETQLLNNHFFMIYLMNYFRTDPSRVKNSLPSEFFEKFITKIAPKKDIRPTVGTDAYVQSNG